MPRVSNITNTAPLDFPGLAVAPAVAPAGSARMYFDSGTGKLRASESGGAYVDVLGGGGATFPLLAPTPGTALAPDYSFTGDTDTGFYSDVAGEEAWAADAVESVRFTKALLIHVKGLATFDVSPAALAAGNNNNYAIADGHVFRIVGGAASVITGIVAPNPSRTRFLVLVNVGAVPFTIAHLSGLSLAANQIVTTSGAALAVNVSARVYLFYDTVSLKWRCSFPI